MPGPFGPILESRTDQGALVLTVLRPRIEGEETAHELRAALLAAVAHAGPAQVVIDLRQVRYLSSVAFWPLLALRRQLLDAGGRLLICGLSEDIEDVFATTKMIDPAGTADAPFEVAADVAAALARLRGA